MVLTLSLILVLMLLVLGAVHILRNLGWGGVFPIYYNITWGWVEVGGSVPSIIGIAWCAWLGSLTSIGIGWCCTWLGEHCLDGRRVQGSWADEYFVRCGLKFVILVFF